MSTPAGEPTSQPGNQSGAQGVTVGGGGGSATVVPGGIQGATSYTVVPPQAQQPAAAQQPTGIDAFPEEAQKVIRDLRQESQRYRQGSEQAAQAAAEQAKKELAQTIGKALGIVDDTADPAKLTEQLTASQASQREVARELAVFKAAPAAGADPARLLDSRSFLAAIDGIDPADGEKITDAIKAAVQANPTLGVAPTVGASTVDHAGGSGEGAVTPDQFKAMGYGERAKLYQANRALYDQLAAATIG